MANSTNIPQANSVETLVHVVETLRDGLDTVELLVREFQVRERTIHYYLELAEWLGFLEDRQATSLRLSELGLAFASDVSRRGTLYHDAIMRQDLVTSALARIDGLEGGALSPPDADTLRAAFIEVITELDVLAEAPARRRAGALATLVEAALTHDAVEWESGRIGQPTRMRRTYAAHDAPPSERHVAGVPGEDADTTTWERARDPEALVGEERFTTLESRIMAVLEAGPATSSAIREELALRWEVPLTDPSVFVVLRAGLDAGKWKDDGAGQYLL